MPVLRRQSSTTAEAMEVSSERRQKTIDDSLHDINKIMQAWKKRFTPAAPHFDKRFLSGEQNIILHFRTRIDSPELWVAEFVQKRDGLSITEKPLSMKPSKPRHSDNEAVFTEIVEVMKPPKRLVPSLVRLDLVKDFYRFRSEQLFVSPSGIYVSGFILAYREVNALELPVSGSRPMCFRQLVSEMIQSPREVVKHVSSGSKGVERNVIKRLPWRSLYGVHIHIHARDIAVSSENEEFHLCEILFGPLNLRAN